MSFILCQQTVVNGQQSETAISFRAAVDMMMQNNPNIKAAEKNVELTRRQSQFINSSWYPTITMTGTYVVMSDKISVSQEYASLLEPIKEKYENTFIVPDVINYISNELGEQLRIHRFGSIIPSFYRSEKDLCASASER